MSPWDHPLVTPAIIGCLAIITLLFAAEKAVKKIHALADHFDVSLTFAGLTVFSITTSFPEIFAHVTASMNILAGTMDYRVVSGTVLGANIGSDVIQQTLILGLVVLIMGGLEFKRQFLLTAYLPMIGTTLLCILLGWDGMYSRLDGLILLGTFFAYMGFLYHREQLENHRVHFYGKADVHVVQDSLIAVGSMILMLFSSHWLLFAAEDVVAQTGLGASLIGVVTIGVASAAPELFTAILGVKRGATGISLGTLIGSNITNPLVAIGGGALISTYWVPRPLVYWDLAMETVTAALLLAYLLLKKRPGFLGKAGACYLMILYLVYLFVRVQFFSTD